MNLTELAEWQLISSAQRAENTTLQAVEPCCRHTRHLGPLHTVELPLSSGHNC